MIIVDKGRYVLRTWEPEDAPALAKHIDNRKIWDNLRDDLPFPYTTGDAVSFIKSVTENPLLANYCISAGNEAIGNIGFSQGRDVERFSAEAGYWISEEFWNQGIMTDALKWAIDHYFTHSEAVRLYATVYAFNTASARVLEKAGFSLKCTLTRAAFKNGKFTDVFYYEKIKKP